MRQLLIPPLLLAWAAGCATTTTIVSDPPGAKVIDNAGKVLGTTPYAYTSEEGTIFDEETVRVEKEGYRPATVTLERSEIDTVPFATSLAGVVCLAPTLVLWIPPAIWFYGDAFDYPGETQVTLSPAD